jgi:DoxX-like family
MQHETHATPVSGPALWSGRVMSALPVLFLIFDGVTKLAKAGFVIEATVKLGYPETAIVGIGLVLLIATISYVIPLTSVLGAVLLTGYLGGAVASHVRVDNPLFSHTLFPIYMALLIWGGLYLRDQRLRTLFPLRIQRTKE